MSDQLVGSHRQIAPQAVEMHECSRRDMFVLNLFPRTSHQAPIDGACDNSQWAEARMMVVGVRMMATEGAAFRGTERHAR